MDLDFRDLEMVEQLAGGATLTVAAQRLFVSQPALSQRLRALEERFGAPLFERTPRGMQPTAAGQRLATGAAQALTALRAAAKDIALARSGGRRELRITSQCSTSYQWLAPIAGRFRELHPEVELRIVSVPQDDPAAALQAQSVDVALVCKANAANRHVAMHPLFEDVSVAVVATGHPWASRASIAVGDFATAHVVLYDVYEQSRTDPVPLPLPAGAVPARMTTTPVVTQLLLEVVAGGDAVTVLPRWVAEPYQREGRVVLVPMAETPPPSLWHVATRRDAVDPATRAFVEVLIENLRGRAPRYANA